MSVSGRPQAQAQAQAQDAIAAARRMLAAGVPLALAALDDVAAHGPTPALRRTAARVHAQAQAQEPPRQAPGGR